MFTQILNLYKRSLTGLSRIVWLLAITSFINRSGAMVVPFMTIYLTTQLNFSEASTGWLMGCFGAGSVLGSYLGGKLTDKVGYLYTIFGSFLFGGCIFFLLMQMEDFYSIALTIFLLSLINDLFRPAIFSAVAAFSKPDNQTRSISLIRLAINLGYAAGPALGGILLGYTDYKMLFIIDGTTCILAALFIWFTIPKDQPVSRKQKSEMTNPNVQNALKDSLYLFFVSINTLVAVIFMQLIFIIPMYLKTALDYNEQAVGLLLALNCLLVAIIELPLVHFLEDKKSLLYWTIIGVLFIGVSYLCLITGSNLLIFPILYMFFISIGEVLVFPFTNSFAINKSEESSRGQYMGLYSMGFSVALILAPIMGTQIISLLGFGALWLILAALSLVAVAGYWYIDKLHH